MFEKYALGFCNINGLMNKTDDVLDFFVRNKLDIFFLVETWLKPNSGAHLNMRNLVYLDVRLNEEELEMQKMKRGSEGIMVLARSEVRPLIKVLKRSESKRWVLLKVAEYFIVCCYFSPSVPVSEICEMLEYVNNHADVDMCRTMFVGDFNARLGSLSDDSMTNARGTWFKGEVLDGCQLKRCNPIGDMKWTSINSNGKGIPDHLLVSADADFLIIDFRVREECAVGGSDHRPLIWSVHASRMYNIPIISRWNRGRLKHPTYAKRYSDVLHATFFDTFTELITLAQSFESMNVGDVRPANARTVVNQMYAVFLKWLNFACSVSIGKAHFDLGGPDRKFATTKVEEARRAMELVCGQIGQAPPGMHREKYAKYKEARGYYKSVCSERKYELHAEWVEEMALAGNSGMFQKKVHAMKKRAAKSCNQLDPEKMNEHEAFFRTTFGAKPCGDETEERRCIPDPSVCTVDFAVKSIEEKLADFTNGKAAGPDDVFIELVKHEGNLASQLLSILFKACFAHTIIPDMWCKANVALVFKNKGDIMNVANYRPISLTCVVRKVYERMLMRYLVPVAEEILHPNQGGFRPNRGTMHQCYVLHEVMVSHPSAIHAFLDMSAAYDCVNRNLLWREMEKYGVNAHMISVCQSLFDYNHSNLVVNGVRSNDLKCRRGLLQGSTMSPLLFNLYINSLIQSLDTKFPKLHTKGLLSNNLFYADDIELHAQYAAAMQDMLDECDRWRVSYGMSFAVGKCAIVSKKKKLPDFVLQGGIIPVVKTFPFLGVDCDGRRLCFTKKQSARCEKMVTAAKFLRSKGMNASGWRLICSVLVYKSFLRPMMEYGCQLMDSSDSVLPVMEKAQNAVLSMMISCAGTTARGAKLKLLGIETMEARRELLQFQFFNGLDKSVQTNVPASTLWRSSAHTGPLARTRMQSSAVTNPIFVFSSDHDQNETSLFIRQRKFASTATYDKTNAEGMHDVAASIRTSLKKSLSVYSDPLVDKECQILIICLRLGSFAFHQTCAKCGEATSRAHAMECSGEGVRLQNMFGTPREMSNDVGLRYQDRLLNLMDTYYDRGTPEDKTKALLIFDEVCFSARVIRESISGYIQSDDGKAWYHPLKSKRKFSYVHHKQDIKITLRRKARRAELAALKVRIAKGPTVSQQVATFEPP